MNVYFVEYLARPKQKYVNFKEGRLSLSCRSTEEVQMTITDTNVGIQHHIREIVFSSADNFKYGAAADLVMHESQSVLRGKVNCVTKNTNEVLWSWEFDTDYSCNCSWAPRTGKISIILEIIHMCVTTSMKYFTLTTRYYTSNEVLFLIGSYFPWSNS